ncbi:MAG: hypothetical protein WBN96_06590 [Gammaproteobacteria bacterium]
MIHPATQQPDSDIEAAPAFVSLSIGDVKILTQQSNITSIESSVDVDYSAGKDGAIGSINFNNQSIPVFRFNDQFECVNDKPGNIMVCAVLKNNAETIALMCQEVAAFRHPVVKINPLPECMQMDVCPVDSLCLYADNNQSKIGFVISANSLLEYFRVKLMRVAGVS